MRRHEDLRGPGCLPAFLREPVEQARMEEVLRLLDADERRWSRVMQQYEIGERLQRAVGCESGHDRLPERGVLDLQQQSSVLHPVGGHRLDLGNSLPEPSEYELEVFGMLFGEVLYDVREVGSGLAQPFCGPASGCPRASSDDR